MAPVLEARQLAKTYETGGAKVLGLRGVELTPAGRALDDDVSSVLAVVEQIKKEAHRAERGAKLKCLIGVVPHPYIDQLVADAHRRVERDGSRASASSQGRVRVPVFQPGADAVCG